MRSSPADSWKKSPRKEAICKAEVGSLSLLWSLTDPFDVLASAAHPTAPKLALGTFSLGESALTILPFSCGRIDDAKEFIICDCFRIQVSPDRAALHDLIGLVQGSQHLWLASASTTDHEHRVPYCQQLLQLDHLGRQEGQPQGMDVPHLLLAAL